MVSNPHRQGVEFYLSEMSIVQHWTARGTVSQTQDGQLSCLPGSALLKRCLYSCRSVTLSALHPVGHPLLYSMRIVNHHRFRGMASRCTW